MRCHIVNPDFFVFSAWRVQGSESRRLLFAWNVKKCWDGTPVCCFAANLFDLFITDIKEGKKYVLGRMAHVWNFKLSLIIGFKRRTKIKHKVLFILLFVDFVLVACDCWSQKLFSNTECPHYRLQFNTSDTTHGLISKNEKKKNTLTFSIILTRRVHTFQ